MHRTQRQAPVLGQFCERAAKVVMLLENPYFILHIFGPVIFVHVYNFKQIVEPFFSIMKIRYSDIQPVRREIRYDVQKIAERVPGAPQNRRIFNDVERDGIILVNTYAPKFAAREQIIFIVSVDQEIDDLARALLDVIPDEIVHHVDIVHHSHGVLENVGIDFLEYILLLVNQHVISFVDMPVSDHLVPSDCALNAVKLHQQLEFLFHLGSSSSTIYR
jgi:hypothetical protein